MATEDDELKLRRVLYEAAAHGFIEVSERNDEPIFRLTDSGVGHVHGLVDDYVNGFGDDAEEMFAAAMGLPLEVAVVIFHRSLEQRGLTRPD